jgi:hypothetical protein
MTTNTKLYGKDLSAYEDVDVDTLLSQLSPEEINILAKEVDPDVSTIYVSFVTRIVLHEVFELMLSIVTISVLN